MVGKMPGMCSNEKLNFSQKPKKIIFLHNGTMAKYKFLTKAVI